jgi:hypothetical protein
MYVYCSSIPSDTEIRENNCDFYVISSTHFFEISQKDDILCKTLRVGSRMKNCLNCEMKLSDIVAN